MKKFYHYKVEYSKVAQKFFKNDKINGLKFFKAFEEIINDKENVKKYDIAVYKVKNEYPAYRLKIGGYRAIFEDRNDKLVVFVIKIGPRGDIYK